MNYYGIPGVSNNWFNSYLSNHNQYVSISGFESGLTTIKLKKLYGPSLWMRFNCLNARATSRRQFTLNCDINKGSVNNQAIKFGKVHPFADDNNLLCLRNSIKKLNKLVNTDLKHLHNWLNANKISLNVKKTEMVIFKSK